MLHLWALHCSQNLVHSSKMQIAWLVSKVHRTSHLVQWLKSSHFKGRKQTLIVDSRKEQFCLALGKVAALKLWLSCSTLIFTDASLLVVAGRYMYVFPSVVLFTFHNEQLKAAEKRQHGGEIFFLSSKLASSREFFFFVHNGNFKNELLEMSFLPKQGALFSFRSDAAKKKMKSCYLQEKVYKKWVETKNLLTKS